MQTIHLHLGVDACSTASSSPCGAMAPSCLPLALPQCAGWMDGWHRSLRNRLQLSAGAFKIVEAARVTTTSAFFTVNTLEQATLPVSKCRLLKETGATLYELLSPRERVRPAPLMPEFRKAHDAGQFGQFCCARLFVNLLLVAP